MTTASSSAPKTTARKVILAFMGLSFQSFDRTAPAGVNWCFYRWHRTEDRHKLKAVHPRGYRYEEEAGRSSSSAASPEVSAAASRRKESKCARRGLVRVRGGVIRQIEGRLDSHYVRVDLACWVEGLTADELASPQAKAGRRSRAEQAVSKHGPRLPI
jgi:hypothetical protein